MIVLYTINFILIGLVSVTALVIMIYWHRATNGGWKDHPSGRSLMGLLGIIMFITANAAVQTLLPGWVPLGARATFYFLLYGVFIFALIKIGLTIRNEVHRGKRYKANLPETGAIHISHLTKDSTP